MSFSSWVRGLGKTQQANFAHFFTAGELSDYTSLSDRDAIIKGYMQSSAFYTIVNKAATGVASLPLKLMVESDGGLEEVTTGDAYDFIMYPNENQTIREFWQELAIYYFTNGEFFSYFNQKSVLGLDGEIISLPPELVKVNSDNDQSILSKVVNYTFEDGIDKRTILPEDMLHVKMTNPSVEGRKSKNGLSPLQAGKTALSTSNQIEVAGEVYFKNGGSKVIISGSDKAGQTLMPKDKLAINEAFKIINGGAERMNQAHISNSPITVNEISAPSTDMQMIENSLKELRKLASLIGLPAIMVGDMANSTYNNYATAVKHAYTDVYIPTANTFIDGYNRTYLKLLSKREGRRYTLQVDIAKIEALNLSTQDQQKLIIDQVNAGLISRNEARVELKLEESEHEEMNIPTINSGITTINTLSNAEETK